MALILCAQVHPHTDSRSLYSGFVGVSVHGDFEGGALRLAGADGRPERVPAGEVTSISSDRWVLDGLPRGGYR